MAGIHKVGLPNERRGRNIGDARPGAAGIGRVVDAPLIVVIAQAETANGPAFLRIDHFDIEQVHAANGKLRRKGQAAVRGVVNQAALPGQVARACVKEMQAQQIALRGKAPCP